MKILATTILILFLTSCSSEDQVKNALTKNPEILANIIKENPVLFMQALSEANQIAQSELSNRKKEDEKNQIEKFKKNPIKVELAENEIIRGNPNGSIEIIAFTDFQCPFCSRGANTINTLMEKNSNKVKLIVKHLPLDFHPQALISAKYFEAIGLQSHQKAFQFYDIIFKEQQKLSQGDTFLKSIAKKLNLDLKKLDKDLASEEIKNKINKDIELARKLEFLGTPGFLVNGIPVKGAYPLEYFESLL